MLQDTLHIKGLSELDAKLDALPVRVRKNLLNKALRAAGKVIGMEARRQVPRVWQQNAPTRLLKRSNIVWRTQRIRRNIGRVRITWRTDRDRGDAETTPVPFYGHWVEFGFTHPSGTTVPAKPFLRPAWNISYKKALEMFRKTLGEGIEEAVQ